MGKNPTDIIIWCMSVRALIIHVVSEYKLSAHVFIDFVNAKISSRRIMNPISSLLHTFDQANKRTMLTIDAKMEQKKLNGVKGMWGTLETNSTPSN